MDKARIISVLKMQHMSIDVLMALLITRETEMLRLGAMKRSELFMPSESGDVWDGLVAGNLLISLLEREEAPRA